MINNKTLRNCTTSFPVIQGMHNPHALGKILIKNMYQSWQGESIKQIKEKHKDNPYSLRIGMPTTDDQLKGDNLYFILHYLSYNPLTKDIEKRELIPYRNTEKVYIGQSIDEKVFSDFRLFADGNIVAKDYYFKDSKDVSLQETITNLTNMVQKLQSEVVELKRQLNSKHIYTQGTS